MLKLFFDLVDDKTIFDNKGVSLPPRGSVPLRREVCACTDRDPIGISQRVVGRMIGASLQRQV